MGYPAFPSPAQTGTQLVSTTTFGVAEVDGTTITAAGGVISAASQTSGFVQGPASSTSGDFALWNNSSGTLLKDATATQVTALLNLFTSSLQGLVPAPGGTDDTSGFYLGGDGNWHAVAATPALVYLGTVTESGGAIIDSPSGTNIIGANNSTYRSFKLIFKNVICSTNGATIQLQVHSGGSFQSSSYLSTIGAASAIGLSTSVANSDPGLSGALIVSNLASTSVHKIFSGAVAIKNSSGNAAVAQPGGFWNGGTGAIDGFQIIDSVGSTDLSSGSIDIYGIL